MSERSQLLFLTDIIKSIEAIESFVVELELLKNQIRQIIISLPAK